MTTEADAELSLRVRVVACPSVTVYEVGSNWTFGVAIVRR